MQLHTYLLWYLIKKGELEKCNKWSDGFILKVDQTSNLIPKLAWGTRQSIRWIIGSTTRQLRVLMGVLSELAQAKNIKKH